MKKITSILIALLLVVAMVASLAACGSNDCGEGNHKWNTGEITKSATCTEDGTKVYTCTVCGATREETIPASHTYGSATSISDEQHQKECTVCHEDTVTEGHKFTYTPISGQQKHTKGCSECNFSKEEDCTIEDGKCTLCNANYSQDPTTPTEIKVHFHIPEGWTADNVHAYAWNGKCDPLIGAYPGKAVTAEEDGWCVVTFETEEQYANIQINFNDYVGEGNERKTGDVVLVAAECYVPAIEGGTKSYATKADALAAEEVKVPEDAWFITGYFNGVVAWTDSTNDYDRVFQESNGYSLTSTFAATNDFKVKQNDGSWDNNVLGYDNLGEITSDVFEGNLKSLFTRGEDDKANNIVVNYVCELTITFDTANQKINIKILSAEGFNPDEGDEPEPTPTPTDGYVLVGQGVEGSDLKEWTDELPLQSETLDSGVLHYSLKVTFKAGDEFKVRLAGDEGFLQKNFGFSNVNWDSANEAVKDDLIEAGDSDNIKVKKGFTGYVNVYSDSDQLTIYVESVEEEVPGPQPEKDAVIVHFHKIEGWGTSFHVYIWYGSEELSNKVEVLGKWPGTGTLTVEEGNWYKGTFSVDKGHVGVDLKIIVSDGTIQTGDILVEQAEIYIPGLTKDQNGTKAYKTAQEAEAADSVKVEFAYFLSGSMNEWGTPDTHKFTAGSDGSYTLKGVALKKDDQFKIRDNSLKPTYLGYDELAKSGTAIGKFSKFDKAGDSGYGNFVVNEDCTVDITFNPTAKTIKVDLAAHVHVKTDAITVVTAAQCETVGAGYYKCTQCDKRLNAEGKEIGDTETIEIPALGHQADKKHEKVSATCDTDGTEEYYDCVRNCGAKVNQNGEVIPQEQLTIPATGHKYTSAEEAWTWNSDHSTATLHLVCTTDGDHTKTIDVTPQKSSRAQDCTTEGTITFTASITRDQIKAQLGAKDELTIDDAKLSAEYVSETSEILGHNWVVKDSGYSWADGAVTVTLVCSREAEKELTLTFTVEGKVTDPTCVDDRFTTYTLDKTAAETETEARKQHVDDDFFTAHDAFAALKDVNTVTEADSALGHEYEGQPFVDAGEGKHHQKCTRCEVYSEATEHELSFVPDGATMHRNKCSKCTYSETPVAHDALTYEKVDGTYHRATCATCHYEGDNVTHTYGNYTHIGDKNTESHQATCTASGCGATDTQPCTTDNRDICTSCQHDFRLDVKVHFHRGNAWTGSVYVWAWYEGDKNGNCVVTGDKPTSECLMKSETVAGSDDWWQIEIKYPRDVTCKIMFTSDSNFTHKTSDHAFIFASEIWCAKSGEVFNSSAAALEAENIPAPTSSDWFVTGTHIGWAETVADWQYAFGEMGKTAHYEVTLQLQQSNTFKFKTNDLWATCQQVAFSTTNKYTITKADGLSGETKYLIYNDYDDNFLVAYDCTLKLTYDKTTQKFTIEVVKCEEMPSAKPTFEYTIHIFVPTSLKGTWTNMYVWAFDGPIDNTKNGANIDDNPTKEDVLTSSLGVWKKYTASSDKPYGSSKQGMLFATSNWAKKFGCDNKTNEGGSDNRFKLMKDTYFRAAESNKTYPTAADAENNTNATKW